MLVRDGEDSHGNLNNVSDNSLSFWKKKKQDNTNKKKKKEEKNLRHISKSQVVFLWDNILSWPVVDFQNVGISELFYLSRSILFLL